MAIAYDTSTSDGPVTIGAGGSRSWAHTCTGNDRLLVVYVFANNANTATVTYNGVSMTAGPVNSNNGAYQAFYLVNPASGSNNIQVSAVSSIGSTISLASSYTGVLQTSPLDSSSGTYNELGSPTSYDISFSVTNSDCWIMSGVYVNAAGSTSPSAGTNTTRRIRAGSVGKQVGSFDTNGTVPSGASTIGWTSSAAQFKTLIMAFREAPGATNSNFLALL